MTNNPTRSNHQLPDNVAQTFLSLQPRQRDAYIDLLRDLEWTLESIAQACNLTRERVRQISNKPQDHAVQTFLMVSLQVPLPFPPQKTKPETKIRKKSPDPTPETLTRLLYLQPFAQQVRSNRPDFRAEAEEYTALLHKANTQEGVTIYRLAQCLGITNGAIRFRLARYGYLPETSATSKVYKRINPNNRHNPENPNG